MFDLLMRFPRSFDADKTAVGMADDAESSALPLRQPAAS
jgi:hypothetical protein